jgi:lipid-binding SYLF domain-containing protein
MRLLEADRVPDWLIRHRIRALLAQRLREEDKGGPEAQQAHLMQLVHQLRESPIAINTAGASIGLQVGGQKRDIVIFMNTETEVANFLDDGVYALAEASAVAGPAKTDPMNAGGPVPSSYYYIRSKGLFGGLLVGGVYFTVDNKINRETYGENATVGEILSDKLPKPQGATILTQALDGN